jgi:hypothetical protein
MERHGAAVLRSLLRKRGGTQGLGANSSRGSAARRLGATGAQQGDRIRRIGVLYPADENDPLVKSRFSAFTQALADLGWTVPRNMRMDLRWPALTPIG